jgi:hypothetical protein
VYSNHFILRENAEQETLKEAYYPPFIIQRSAFLIVSHQPRRVAGGRCLFELGRGLAGLNQPDGVVGRKSQLAAVRRPMASYTRLARKLVNEFPVKLVRVTGKEGGNSEAVK